MRIPVRDGTLYVDPAGDPLVTGGIVQYRIYQTGDIYYSGDVSYFGSGPLTEVQRAFSGHTKVAPEDVSSSSYTRVAARRPIKKVTFEVDAFDAETNTAKLYAFVNSADRVDSLDAEGQITVDLSQQILRITDANVSGSIYQNTPFATSITLHLTETRP